jgi:hypothetical protein
MIRDKSPFMKNTYTEFGESRRQQTADTYAYIRTSIAMKWDRDRDGKKKGKILKEIKNPNPDMNK